MALIVIISGPKGSGQTSLARALIDRIPDSTKIMTSTTRAMRPGEVHGEHYFFMTDAEFLAEVVAENIFEWTKRPEGYYGSSKKTVEASFRAAKVVVAVVDYAGLIEYKKHFKERALTLALEVNSLSSLERRIQERDRLSDEEMRVVRESIHTAQQKLKQYEAFIDRRIDNSDGRFDQALEEALQAVLNHPECST